MAKNGIGLSTSANTLILLFVTALFQSNSLMAAENVDLSQAVIVSGSNRRDIKAAEFLQIEIQRRCGISLEKSTSMPKGPKAVIVLGSKDNFPCSYNLPSGLSVPNKADGYAIWIDTTSRKAVTVFLVGSDDRGALFAAGRLIRLLGLGKGYIGLDEATAVEGRPDVDFRGHQIAYRGLNNTTDKWDIQQYEQQIRDLIIFGTDTIELIPVLDRETRHEPHMQMTIWKMNEKLSELIDEYGLDLWIYKSIFTREVDTPAKEAGTLARWKEMLESLHGLDAILGPKLKFDQNAEKFEGEFPTLWTKQLLRNQYREPFVVRGKVYGSTFDFQSAGTHLPLAQASRF